MVPGSTTPTSCSTSRLGAQTNVEQRYRGGVAPVAASSELLSVSLPCSTALQANVLAYAVHCQTGNRGRPVAGAAVICKDRLAEATYSHQSTVQVNNSHSIKSLLPFLCAVLTHLCCLFFLLLDFNP